MKKILLYALVLITSIQANAQAPNIQWQKTYGGYHYDAPSAIRQTSDSGYVVAGTSASNTDDVSGNHGNTDVWITKMNSSGTITWQKSYGGNGAENANDIDLTLDGGYIIAGATHSGNSGDVRGNHDSIRYDYWVIKIDSAGGLQWQKCLGGSLDDEATSVRQARDGGYIVAGSAYSRNGDVISGRGNFNEDYWVVKLSSSGAIQWQKSYGGTDRDNANDIELTSDGGYIIAGQTLSRDGDVSGNSGTSGAVGWVVKTNDTGGIVWQQVYLDAEYIRGIRQTHDGGYLIAGNTSSSTTPGYHGSADYWVSKISSSGGQLWKHAYGGGGNEFLNSLELTGDGGCVLAGFTASLSSGDVAGNHGNADYWVVKLDSTGALAWQKSMGGSFHDEALSAQQTLDGGYIIAGSISSNDGDITKYYGGEDYWIVKLQKPVGVSSVNSYKTLMVYPNPAEDVVNIDVQGMSGKEAHLYDMTSHEVSSTIFRDTGAAIHMNGLPAGIYLLVVDHSALAEIIKR